MSAEPVSGLQLALIGEARAYGAASVPWKQRWEDTIRVLADLPGQEFDSEVVRKIAGDPDDHPNAAGAIFAKLARQGVIEHVGYRKAERPSLHAHPLSIWKGRS